MNEQYMEMSPMSQYLNTIYLTTIVSYGNLIAHNDFERFFALVIMVFGGLLMTYSISALGQIIVGMDQRSAQFECRLDILNRI